MEQNTQHEHKLQREEIRKMKRKVLKESPDTAKLRREIKWDSRREAEANQRSFAASSSEIQPSTRLAPTRLFEHQMTKRSNHETQAEALRETLSCTSNRTWEQARCQFYQLP